MGGEDRLGEASSQGAARVRGPGLDQHRMPLRRAGHIQRPLRGDVLSPVVRRMHPGGVGPASCDRIDEQGVLLEGVP